MPKGSQVRILRGPATVRDVSVVFHAIGPLRWMTTGCDERLGRCGEKVPSQETCLRSEAN